MIASALEWITLAIEIGGIVIIIIGIIGGTAVYLQDHLASRNVETRFREYRSRVGKAILLGLEFLVAADIINTVAIEPTMNSVLVLGGIVSIRTFLSISLEVEIEGRWPWTRASSQNG